MLWISWRLNRYSVAFLRVPIAPRVDALILNQALADQLFSDACAIPSATLAANQGTNEICPLVGCLRMASFTFEHDLLWAPPVGAPEVAHLLNLVVRWYALDDFYSPLSAGVRCNGTMAVAHTQVFKCFVCRHAAWALRSDC